MSVRSSGRGAAALLLVLGSLFLAYQMWLSARIWARDGNIPPGFDDSYFYIFAARKVVDHEALLPQTPYPPRYSHLVYLSYNHLLASMASLADRPVAEVYRLSFFFGKLVLLLCLLRLLAALEADPLVRAAALAGLVTYSGPLGAHGFYWVVPTFWLLCVFFYWAGEVTDRRDRCGATLAATGFLGGTLHPLAPYLLVVLAGHLLLLLAFRRRGGASGSVSAFFWVAAGILAAGALPDVLSGLPAYRGTLDMPPTAFTQLGGAWRPAASAAGPGLYRLMPGLEGVVTTYLKVFATPLPLAALAGSLALLVRLRRWNLLSLFAASAALTLGTTLHPLAYRTTLVLWPVTIMVLASAPALAWYLIRPRLRHRGLQVVAAGALAAAVCGLALAWHLFNRTVVIPQMAAHAGSSWDEGCADRLLGEVPADAPVYYGSKLATSAFLARGLERRGVLPVADLRLDARESASGRWWAVVENPAEMPGAAASDQVSTVEGIARQAGLAALRKGCGVFLVFKLARP